MIRIQSYGSSPSWYQVDTSYNQPSITGAVQWNGASKCFEVNNGSTWLKKLVNDEYYGRLGTNSTKIIGYREMYPDLIERKKQTGFEKIDFLANELESFLTSKYKGLPFRQFDDRSMNKLWLDITGNNLNDNT